VSKTVRPYAPGQAFLLPPSPLDWLPEDHLARFIMDVVKKLDLAGVYQRYEGDLRGYPPYHPQMMVALLLYGYCVGVPSSWKIEKRTHEDIAFRVIAGGAQPDHSSIAEFRRVHLNTLAELFVQVLRLCQAAGMVKLGHVSLDGTKMKANASKHKAMSYERMQKDEQRLREKVADLLKAAATADAEEDKAHGKHKRGDELPEDLRRAKDRLARIDELKAALEAEARAQHEAEKSAENDDSDPPPPGATPLPTHKVPRTKDGTPGPKSQRNFTDPESRIMKGGDGFVQGYNCQAAVDAEHQIIVAHAVTNQPPDVEHLIPMVEGGRELRGDPREVVCGRRLFLGAERDGDLEVEDRSVHRDGTPQARRDAAVGARQATGESHDQTADGAQACDEAGRGRLRAAKSDPRARLRADQGSSRLSPIPAARARKGARRVVAHRADPQPPEASRGRVLSAPRPAAASKTPV
jgi:transposase